MSEEQDVEEVVCRLKQEEEEEEEEEVEMQDAVPQPCGNVTMPAAAPWQ